jgi:endonuclease III
MLKKERAIFIDNTLNSLYPDPPIPLDHTNTFTLLIAVLLSAQCTDERVNKITPALFKLADNPLDMSCLSVDTIKAIIKPCGLSPKKSKAIWELSHKLLSDYNGQVPESLSELETLAGVGHKTASVVMSQAFNVPAFAVDTHIHRLAQRWGLTKGKNVTQTERDLKKIFPKERWNALHLQIIYYAREHCSARQCYGLSCLICTHCYPNRKKPIKTIKA